MTHNKFSRFLLNTGGQFILAGVRIDLFRRRGRSDRFAKNVCGSNAYDFSLLSCDAA